MEVIEREVNFAEWCPKCTSYEKKEIEEPCSSCLCIITNEYTDKPVEFKAKEN